jgi:hypothetical protein
MQRPDSHARGKSCIALVLVLALLGGPAAAKTSATSFAEEPPRSLDAWVGGVHDPQATADLLPAGASYRVLAVSAGALAGAIVGIVLTGGLATPAGAAAMLTPSVALAAREGALYAARAVAVMITAGVGGFIGNWLYQGR